MSTERQEARHGDLRLGPDSPDVLRRALSEAAIGMCLVARDGAFLEVNEALCEFFGRSAEDLAARTWQELTHPDDLGADLVQVDRALRGEIDRFQLTKRFRHADGSDRVGQLAVRAVRHQDGAFAFFVSQIVDVTAQVAAEQALTASMERYRLLAHHASDVVSVVGPDGSIAWVSPSVESTLGWTPADFVARAARDYLHPDDEHLVDDVLRRALAGEDRVRLRHRHRCPDGSYRWLDSVIAVERDASGRPTAGYVSSRDVEDEVRAEAARDEAEQLYRLLAESASDVVYRTDASGRCTWISPSVATELGWTPEELIGVHVPSLVHPDDLRAAEPARRAAVDQGSTSPRPLELRFATKAGGWRWMSARARVVLDEDGRADGGVTALRDVQEQVEARLRLRESEENFRVIAEHSSDITIRTRHGIAEWISPSIREVLGWAPEDLIGSDLTSLVHPDDRPRVLRARDAAGPGSTSALRYRAARADGSWRWVEVLTRVVADPAGGTDGAVGSVRDVHDEVEAQMALERSRELLRVTLDNLLDPWVLLQAVRDDTGWIVDFVFTAANAAACLANNLDRDELLGRRLLDLLPDHAPTGLLAAYAHVVETGEPLSLDDVAYPSAQHGGALRRFDNRAARVGDGISFTWRDVNERYEARQREAEGARRDPLTGLANRTRLREYVDAILARSDGDGRRGALLYCDIDRFKPVNDTHGHAAGDEVLRQVARRLEHAVRPEDLVARLGGDEFVVVLADVTGQDEAVAVAERVRAAVARPIHLPALGGPAEGGGPAEDGGPEGGGGSAEDGGQQVTLSVGVALLERGRDPDQCLRAADAALYQAKARGRDRVVAAPGLDPD